MQRIYSFDRIKISSMRTISELKNDLPIEYMNQYCKKFYILPNKSQSFYQSTIAFTVPKIKFLKMLHEFQHLFSPYRLSHVEIAKDVFFNSRDESDQQAFKAIKSTRKKYSRNHQTYDQRKVGTFLEPDIQADKYGTITAKDEGKTSGFRIYARDSKITNQPCLHSEFFFRFGNVIAKRTGIKTIEDLINFDIPTFFESEDKRILAHDESIDLMKLGKFLLDWTRRRKFSKRQKMSIQLKAQQFLTYNKIESYADLIHYFQLMKSQLKTKQGRKSQLETNISNLTDYSRFRR